MLKPEKNYDFRVDLMQVHKKDRRDMSVIPDENELELKNGVCIILPEEENVVIYTAARDFEDYLFVSMNVSAAVSKCSIPCSTEVRLAVNQDIEEASGYMGYRITVKKSGILVEGYDAKGIAQGLYALEDLMNLKAAPYLEYGVIKRKAVFEARSTHSPLGYLEYPDEMLSLIAHYGMDKIWLWMKDMNKSLNGSFVDIRLISERAEKYGIEVYVESYLHHTAHPDDEGAQEFYDKLYGEMFEKCPKIKGVCIIGEAIRFHSRDPKVINARVKNDNIPSTAVASGWWPCCDYPQLLEMIKKAITKYRPDADIIFATYNWGCAPIEERVNLIKKFPEGIIVNPTWANNQVLKHGDVAESVHDYSLRFTGPSDVFIREATATKERGLKLFSNAQCSGRTWDFGVIPYEPMPYRWIEQYKKMLKASDEWGLSGIQENIHYGFHPSFITDLEKQAFFTGGKPLEEVLRALLARDYGKENVEKIDKVMHIWSDAMEHFVPAREDQYGGFRVGPAYPLWITVGWAGWSPEDGKYPSPEKAIFGNRIYFNRYLPVYEKQCSLPGIRLIDQLGEVATLRDMLLEGIRLLEEIENPNDNLLRLINMAWFMYRTTVTVLNVKKEFIVMRKLDVEGTKEGSEKLLDELEKILLEEKENVENTLPLVQVDSRLGWEPSMEYTTDENGLRWKLRQLDYELNHRLNVLRSKLNIDVDNPEYFVN